MIINYGNAYLVLEAQNDFILDAIRMEYKDRFNICARAKHRTEEVERIQQKCAEVIQVCNAEVERRRMRVAA